MITGYVKFAHPAGWGFIVCDGNFEEVYWHVSNVVGRRALMQHDRVRFEIAENARGRGAAKQAIKIELNVAPTPTNGVRHE